MFYGLLAAIMMLTMLNGIVLPVSAGNINASTLIPVTEAKEPDTATDAIENYRIDTIADLIYAAAHPGHYGAGDTIFLMNDLDLDLYNGDFSADFSNFASNAFMADFDGAEHTIFNYKEALPFFNSTVNSTIRNLIFENAVVEAGMTQSAILMRTTEHGAILDNVHIRNSVLSTQNSTYAAALVSFVQNNSKPLSIRNCSVVNTHISTTSTTNAYAMGLFVGRYRTGNHLLAENCIAANSSVSGTTAINHGSGLLIGDIANKAYNGVITSATLKNIGVFNCEYKNYGADSTAYAAVTVVQGGASVTADHIYAGGNKRSSTAGMATADVAMENLFYIIAGTLDMGNNYRVAPEISYVIMDRSNASNTLPAAAAQVTAGYTMNSALSNLNSLQNDDYLTWTIGNNGSPITLNAKDMLFTAGDVNDDGAVNVLDGLIMLRTLSGLTYSGVLEEKAMFLDGDGIVSMADAVLLLRKTAQWEVDLLAAPATATVAKNVETNTYYFDSHTIRILSQNVLHGGSSKRIENDVDMHNSTYRAERQRILIQECGYDPDIVALQEYRHNFWFNQYENVILPEPEYEKYVASRADPARNTEAKAKALGEANGGHTYATAYQPDERLAIFWKNDRFDLVTDANGNPAQGIFWFSETPEVNSPSLGTENNTLSANSDGVYTDNRNRITIWVKLRDLQTGVEFYYFNFHFPNASDEESATVLVRSVQIADAMVNKICQDYGDAAVILGGDMNTDYYRAADQAALNEMAKNYTDVGLSMGNTQGTFPRFSRNITADGQITSRIDFFYTRKDDHRTIPLSYNVLEETFDADYNVLENFGGYNPNWSSSQDNKFFGYWASDHAGIFTEMLIISNETIVSAPQSNTSKPIETEDGSIDCPIELIVTGLNNGTCKEGDVLTATVHLKNGTNLSALPLSLTYDTAVLALDESNYDTNENLLIFEGSVMDSIGLESLNPSIKTGFYSDQNNTEGGLLMTVRFKVIADASLAASSINASITEVTDETACLGFCSARFHGNGIPLAVEFTTKTATASFSVNGQILYGDVDGNGRVETKDVVLLLQEAVGMEPEELILPQAGELDGMPGLSVVDAQMVLWYLKHPESLPLQPIS